MRTNAILFWILAVFMLLMAVVYGVWTTIDNGGTHPEWAGTTAVTLSAVLAGFIAFYVGRVRAAQGGELPEDRLDANIDDGDAELGFFSPWSWWPIVLAGGAAVTFLGLAVGTWLSFIGVPLAIIALVGWVYEYYRGNFAR